MRFFTAIKLFFYLINRSLRGSRHEDLSSNIILDQFHFFRLSIHTETYKFVLLLHPSIDRSSLEVLVLQARGSYRFLTFLLAFA